MALLRRRVGLLLLSAGACVLARLPLVDLSAQDQAPNRHELSLVARDFRWTPNRIELSQDDLVRLTIRSEDIAYSFAIDEYRIVRRVPAGGTTSFEFRADRPGTFRFYSNLTSDRAHSEMQGQLIVQPK
jgi:heme/copper-type cytochrome/quinol oxidase subunit 2